MRRLVSCVSAAVFTSASACGGVHGTLSDEAAAFNISKSQAPVDDGQASDAATGSELQRIKIKFPEPPEDLPREHLRAALVWMDFQSSDASGDGAVETNPSIRSDTAVELTSPFTFELMYSAPAPHAHLDNINSPEDPDQRKKFYSLPSAEVVLYVDGNENGALDLLPLGKPGPGPDRVVALSRGRDLQGSAKRRLLVHKKNPVSAVSDLTSVSSLDTFLTRGLGNQTREQEAAAFPDGMYVVTLSVAAKDMLAQDALLSGVAGTQGALHARRDMAFLRFAFGDVEPAQDSSITLFKVEPSAASWLTRACAPLRPDPRIEGVVLPPPGAAIQCGWEQLLYATSPDDYCGQVDELSKPEWETITDQPWPCGPSGLLENTAYVASSRRLDGHPLQTATAYTLVGATNADAPADWSCKSQVVYDLDKLPYFHMPTIAPEPGSQVRCYGHDALSYVPPRADGCNFKYTYELSSESYEAVFGSEYFSGWDLRAEPPAWWPCDENGQLRAERSYEAPHELPAVDDIVCKVYGPSLVKPEYPPPPYSRVHCLSASEYQLRPLWEDACDGTSVVALSGEVTSDGGFERSWSWSAGDETWPCDSEGKFIPRPGLSAY